MSILNNLGFLCLLAFAIVFLLAPGGQIIGIGFIGLMFFLAKTDKKEKEADDFADAMYEKFQRGEVSAIEGMTASVGKGILPYGMAIAVGVGIVLLFAIALVESRNGNIQPIPNLPKVERPSERLSERP